MPQLRQAEATGVRSTIKAKASNRVKSLLKSWFIFTDYKDKAVSSNKPNVAEEEAVAEVMAEQPTNKIKANSNNKRDATAAVVRTTCTRTAKCGSKELSATTATNQGTWPRFVWENNQELSARKKI